MTRTSDAWRTSRHVVFEESRAMAAPGPRERRRHSRSLCQRFNSGVRTTKTDIQPNPTPTFNLAPRLMAPSQSPTKSISDFAIDFLMSVRCGTDFTRISRPDALRSFLSLSSLDLSASFYVLSPAHSPRQGPRSKTVD